MCVVASIMPSINPPPASRTTDTLVTELDQVARKLVLMEQDLERSEEKVEMNERFVAPEVSDGGTQSYQNQKRIKSLDRVPPSRCVVELF